MQAKATAKTKTKARQVTPAQAARELLARREARRHLLPFAEYCYPKWVRGKHHKIVCEALEAVERGEIRRLMIFAPPRHTKSLLASRYFPAWYVGRNPDKQIICASHTSPLAMDFSADVRDLVGDPLYQNVFPNVKIHPYAAASDRWKTTAGGVYIAAGVGGTIAGRGADVAIIDDPVKSRAEADSPRMRNVAWNWFYGDLFDRLQPGGAIIMMLTRWHEDDLAGRALQFDVDKKWNVIRFEAITEDGECLWPEFWPEETYFEKRNELIGAGKIREWNAKYQSNPTPEEGTYMKRGWFESRWTELPKPLDIYTSSDLAVTDDKSAVDPDWTEHAVWGLGPDKKIYVLDWWSGRTTSDVWIDALIKLVKVWKPRCWYAEAGQIRRAVEPWIKRMCYETETFFRIEWVNPVGDKALRGRSFQGMASMGRVVFPKGQGWAEAVIEQCVAFPGGKHDDKFDAMATGCMAIDKLHPIAIESTESSKPKDGYGFDDDDGDGWKTI